MGEISATLVKALRDRTGVGMMDCKKALAETAGDLEQAIDWLRSHGLSKAAKKSGRATADGLIGLSLDGTRGAVVEVNSETDFVARNEVFQGFVRTVSRLALQSGGDVEALKAMPYPEAGETVGERLTNLIATIGENMNLTRAKVLNVGSGVVGGYIHAAQGEGLGRIGVLVALESDGDRTALAQLGKQLAMHVAAANPLAVARADVPAEVLEREKKIIAEQTAATGKTGPMLEKIVEGRLDKLFYQEVCLLEQVYVLDGERKVGKVVEEAAKAAGTAITIKGFVRFALGETAEKAEAA
jgi:elongation factor Ts